MASGKSRGATCAIQSLERRFLLSNVYVDAASPSASPDGSSWTNAFTDLQAALAAATSGDKILIAGGTYKPTSGTDRTATFALVNGVEMDGGYAGNSNPANPDVRNVSGTPTTLSGDIGTQGDNSDNSIHVLTAMNSTTSTILDGLTVANGFANADGTGLSSGNEGGGLQANDASPLLRNCTFNNNSAIFGGAIFGDLVLPVLSNCAFNSNTSIGLTGQGGAIAGTRVFKVNATGCTFAGNTSNSGSGAIYVAMNPTNIASTLTDCTFTRNSGHSGGAVDIINGSVSYLRCGFFGNTAIQQGGAVATDNFPASLVNCIFSGNAAPSGASLEAGSTTTTVTNCTFASTQQPNGVDVYSLQKLSLSNSVVWGDPVHINQFGALSVSYSDTPSASAGTGNISADPQFVRNPSPGADGKWGTADDDYGDLRLQKTSPCIDAADNTAVPSGTTTDLAGNPRFFDVASVPNTGNGTAPIVDLGAYEAQYVTIAPVAKPGGPYSVAEGGSVMLDGSGSFETGGSIASYQWDFNYDGHTFTADASGKTASFSAAGLDGPATRTIALKVTDSDGVFATASATVNITNAAPTAKFTGGTVALGASGNVSFSAQADPSPADVAAGFKYSYDFNNDGKFEIDNSTSASAAVPATYLVTAGNHTIHGRIIDKDGGFTDYTTTITVTAPKLASISGKVFADNNGNSKLDAGELGVNGRKLYIDKNKNGVLDAGEPTFTTGASGAFTFNGLAAGTYRVRDVLPSGWRRVSPSAGYYDVMVTAGLVVTSKNFAETTRGLISGIVFKDANGNGVKDSTEVGLSGWVVYLDTNNNGKLDAGELSFATGSDGKFSFVVPAGTYHLREVLKSGFRRTTPSTGVYNITLSSGQVVSGKNFGDK